MFGTKNRIYFYTSGIFVIIELSHNFVCSFHRSLHLDMGNGSIFTVIHLRFIGQCSRFFNNNDLHQAMVLGVGSGSTGGFNMSLDQMRSNFSWVTQGWIHRGFGLSHLQQPATTLPWKNAPQAADETRPWNGHPRTTHLCQRLKCFKGEPSIIPPIRLSKTTQTETLGVSLLWSVASPLLGPDKVRQSFFVFSHVFSPPLSHIDMWTCALDISSTAHRPFDQGQKGSLGGGGLKSPPEMLTKPRPKSCNDQYTIIQYAYFLCRCHSLTSLVCANIVCI